jgi:hypothetical protein
VLTVHDLIFHLFPQHHKRLNYWYLNAAMPLFCRRASAIIAVSSSTKRDIVERYDIDEDKVTVIYEAASPHFKPVAAEAVQRVRATYGLPERYLLHVVIVGSKGWLYQDFFRKIDALDMADVVHLPGYVPDADLPAIYGGATLVCVPSLYEGFGLPVLEAMACRAPVVCSCFSSLPEVGGQAARYFDPTDVRAMAEEILTVWKNGDLRTSMSQAGLDRSSEFSWQKAARETKAVYDRLLVQPRLC